VAAQPAGGTLDLRGATLANGVLKATTIQMATGGHGGCSDRRMVIQLDDATAIDAIVVRNLDMGLSQANTTRIGDPDNDYKLPAGVDMLIGTQEARGRLRMGTDAWASVNSKLIAGSGGDFIAYVEDVQIGGTTFGGTSTVTLDMTAVENFLLDCTGTVAIPGGRTDKSRYNVQVKFPQGTAAASELKVGVPENDNSSATLDLNGTVFAVGNSAAIGVNGTINTNVSGTSCGLDLVAAAKLTVADGGLMNIVFKRPKGGGQGIYRGLRWKGDHAAELQALTAGETPKLTWDDTALGAKATIFSAGGYTYVGVKLP
jgi:hypothetical protein